MKKVLLALAVILALSFTAKKFKIKKSNLTYIPSGTFMLNGDTITVMSMVLTTGEVTNGEYLLFLNDLQQNGNSKDYAIALPDSLGWRQPFAYGESYTEYYFRHPAYANYPVVNISKIAAELYCNWYTKKKRVAFPERNFNDFRLPTKLEWIYAAKGGLKHSPYPWGGPYTRNSKGDYLANFAHIGDRNIKRNENGKYEIVSKLYIPYYRNHYIVKSDILTPSKSYFPNGYGLYNMAGNANEMVADENVVMGGDWRSGGYDVRVVSEKPYIESSPLTGFRMVSTYILPK